MALTKITTSLVAVNSLTSANIADNSIDATKIAQNNIVARHIPNATALVLDGGVTIDNITIDGTEIDLSSGDLTVDVADDIILDADGGDIIFKDGGTTIAHLKNDSSDLQIISIVQDKDIILRGNDGGSYVNALTLDMSEAGTATFNSGVVVGGDITKGSGEFKIKNTANGENVGIYTTSSSSELHALKIHSGGNVEVLNGNLVVGNASGATITMNDTDGSEEDFAFVLGANALAMRKTSNSNDIMRLDLTNERVGIGTTSPSATLDVGGGQIADPTIVIDSATGGDPQLIFDTGAANRTGIIQFKDEGTVSGFIKYEHNGDKLNFGSGSSTTVSMTVNDGNVGVSEASTSPVANLDVDGTIVHGNIRNEKNATRTYTDGNATNGGVIEFVSTITGSDEYNCVITWAKGTWSAFSYEFTFSAASWARKIAGGGYHNNTGGTISGHTIVDLYGGSNESDLSLGGSGQTIIFTIQCPNGTHPMVHAKFMIGGSANPDPDDFTVEWVAR